MDAIAVDALGTGDRSFVPDKPDEGFDVIPMWVADMNFPTCPAIPKAIIDRTEHPAYGYFDIRKEYYDEIIKWHEVRNGVTGLTEDCIGYENGVLGGVLSALGIFCSKGDNVLLHSPTYIGFTNSLKNSGYNIIHSPLKKDAQGVWRMDFEDMEEKIKSRHIHAAIFCSPHNPCGRVWTREEILQFTELCRKYDVKIISDEIWSDMTLFGNRHIPTQFSGTGTFQPSRFLKMQETGLWRSMLLQRLSILPASLALIILFIMQLYATVSAKRVRCPITTI